MGTDSSAPPAAAMTARQDGLPVDILLVEDSPTDVELTQEALAEASIPSRLHVVADGEAALEWLRDPPAHARGARPDLILLDLNMPRKSGREVLGEVKSDARLRDIPVIVLSTSNAQADVSDAYHLGANAYIRKPVQFDAFADAIRALERFWLSVVTLPPTGA
jgi:two-component system, chemotaxis family, response regulator Rcp1